MTASCRLTSRLEEGAARRPGNSGSRSWLRIPLRPLSLATGDPLLFLGSDGGGWSLPMAESPDTLAHLAPHHRQVRVGPWKIPAWA